MDLKILSICMVMIIGTLHITVAKSLSHGGNDINCKEVSEEIKKIKNTVDILKEEVSTLKQSYKTTEMEVQDVPVKLSRSRRAAWRRHSQEVAFQATLTRISEKVTEKEPIKYNNVITNIGGGYNRETGIFIAPVAGTYSFNTNIVAEEGNYVEASIQVDDDVKASAISDHRNKLDIWNQGHTDAVLRLHHGAKVFVSVQWPYGENVIHGVGKTSFSGYLIRPLHHHHGYLG